MKVEEGSQFIGVTSHTTSISMTPLVAAGACSCGYIHYIWPQCGDDVMAKATAALLEDGTPELKLGTF